MPNPFNRLQAQITNPSSSMMSGGNNGIGNILSGLQALNPNLSTMLGRFGNQSAPETTYTVGGNTYKVSGTGYGTKVFQQSGNAWTPVTGNGTAPASLQLSAAIKDPRLNSWLTQDDPSIQWDDLIRSTWAKDPTQALAIYGQQAARKPGGVDPTRDSAMFTDQNYWPTVMAGFDGSNPALTSAVKELGTATPQNTAALNQWRSYMSPQEQDARSPKSGLFGGGLLGAIAPIALGFALGPAGLGLSGITGGAVAGGLTSAIGGGDILKGAALGGLGGGISNWAGSNFSSAPSAGFAGVLLPNLPVLQGEQD